MKAALALLILVLAVALGQDQTCPSVSPIRNFKFSLFEGRWYEIGHYRNDGPKVWDEGCRCSTSNVTANPLPVSDGDSFYSYLCLKNDEDGEEELQIFDTALTRMRPPGLWEQVVVSGRDFERHSFSVVELSEDSALVHRCGDYGVAISYTVQFLSRKPTLDAATVTKYKAAVTEYGLNPENVDYVEVPHGNCTYVDQ